MEWSQMVTFLMSKKPSNLPKHLKEYMGYAIDKEKDEFIENRLIKINPHFLLTAYDDLSK
jgi:hypothetical protein